LSAPLTVDPHPWQVTWVTMAAAGLLVAFPGLIVFVLSVGGSRG